MQHQASSRLKAGQLLELAAIILLPICILVAGAAATALAMQQAFAPAIAQPPAHLTR